MTIIQLYRFLYVIIKHNWLITINTAEEFIKEKHYHQVHNYHTKDIDQFESSLIYQSQELFQTLVLCMIEYEERAESQKDKKESKDFDVFELFFRLVSEVQMWLP